MAAEILDVHGATAPNEFKLGWEPVAALLLLLLCDYCYPQTRRYQAPRGDGVRRIITLHAKKLRPYQHEATQKNAHGRGSV